MPTDAMSRHTLWRCALTSLATLLAACSAWNVYPSFDLERGALCQNDVDDDLDGLFDCDDEDCASPACAERTDAQCTNGWDDDDDGRVDLEDLGCLQLARVAVERCVPVGPAEFAPSFGTPDAPAADSGWELIEGDGPELIVDPEDGSRLVARATDETSTVLNSAVLAGRLVGLEVTFDMIAPAGRSTAFGLAVDGDSASFLPDGFQILVDAAGAVSLAGSNQPRFFFPAPAARGERRVSGTLGIVEHIVDGVAQPPRMTALLVVDGRAVSFDAPRANPFPGRPPGAIPATMVDGTPLRVMFVTEGPGAVLLSASARLEAFSACVEDGSAGDSPIVPAAAIGVARSPGQLCVITGEGNPFTFSSRAVARRSSDAGVHWDAPTVALDEGDLGSGTRGPRGVADVALTWTGTGYAGIATITLSSDSLPIVETRLLRSRDCIGWEISDSGLDPMLPGSLSARSVSYEVVEIDGRDEHEITFVSTLGGELGTVLRATSLDGSPGSFAFVDEVTTLPRPARWNRHLFNGLRIHRVGAERLLLYASPDGFRGYLEEGLGHWTEIPTPFLLPSGAPGSLDETTLVFPMLVFDRPEPGQPLRGVLAHSGSVFVGSCPDCGLATVVAPFEITAR